MAKHQFQTEANQILNLMIHSLYSNKEIFIRELVSNASDALDKLNMLVLTNDEYKGVNFSPRIDIIADKEAKTLTIKDSGIGMNEEDLMNNLGTIAKSGTKAFLENLSGDQKKDSHLIGQFGVGFYASFMVAHKVEVTTKKAATEQAYLWISKGDGEFEIEKTTRESHGTTIVMHLNDDESEFLDSYRIEGIIKKYSNHIPFAIFMDKDKFIPAKKDEDGKEIEPSRNEVENIQINRANALWTISKNEISDEEYKDFYSSIAHSSEEPLAWMHNKAEGAIEYTTLFYIPSKAPMDMYRVDYQTGIKLYINRVFITDDEKELMPTYLRFLRGVIDSKDLPLNVSREILQSNAVMAKIKNASVKKVLSELAKMAKRDAKKYDDFFTQFGNVLKEGLYSDYGNRENILELLKFNTINSDEKIMIEEFIKNVDETKKEIYYITGKTSLSMLKSSPALERFKSRGINVLVLNEEIDTIIFPMVTEYKEYKLIHVNDVKFEENENDKKAQEKSSKEFEGLTKELKESLGDSVKSVEVTFDLVDSPVKLKEDKEDPAFMMAQIMKQMGQSGDTPAPAPILQINPKHELIIKLKNSADINLINDAAHLLLDQAKLFDGVQLEDTAGFVLRLNRVIAKAI
ncbi:Heat shock protein Hsp90 [Sulfurimonas denitrificans DSM 1251]|uniref:Chaperone protein HtpG n=1 Tax=Sulfurimonas denitrificans (strain ATCC 33889 / DSM 1251) TaxID=326298 RepID=HTPG_SULDN|nr:molecular chaperone HtpG [Sulfurimonas denitrificans]Q30R39.1 RecName: Full=Chaperone protein HtpG; AltName: Full=Heat shock protein HtpG; AltName: Full=High temperature protein G [Sulfurimonas denitrificans DSM 1251]ABB44542.1 Heat shock protein Hsp90 [Sulfurimonas denitrificans DSM 1251]MDD3441726.1 molecular chaperone HtpG [Sulfurimonas denitrificans]